MYQTKILEPGEYLVRVHSIPKGMQHMKKRLELGNGEEKPIGCGFYWLLEVLENEEFLGVKIFDYLPMEYHPKYKRPYYMKTCLEDGRMKNICKHLGYEKLDTSKIEDLFNNAILYVDIGVKLNKDNERQNVINKYLIKKLDNYFYNDDNW